MEAEAVPNRATVALQVFAPALPRDGPDAAGWARVTQGLFGGSGSNR